MISAIELLAGSAAFGAYLSSNAEMVAYIALVLALCVTLNHTLHPSDKAKDEEQLFTQYMQLAEDQSISLEVFNRRLTNLYSIPGHGFESMRQAAYNDVAKEFGRDDYADKLSLWQRFFSLLA